MEGGVEYSSQKFLALCRYEGKSTFEDASATALADADADGPACGEGEVSSGPEIEKPLFQGGRVGKHLSFTPVCNVQLLILRSVHFWVRNGVNHV